MHVSLSTLARPQWHVGTLTSSPHVVVCIGPTTPDHQPAAPVPSQGTLAAESVRVSVSERRVRRGPDSLAGGAMAFQLCCSWRRVPCRVKPVCRA